MEVVLAIAIGVLTASGVWLLLIRTTVLSLQEVWDSTSTAASGYSAPLSLLMT